MIHKNLNVYCPGEEQSKFMPHKLYNTVVCTKTLSNRWFADTETDPQLQDNSQFRVMILIFANTTPTPDF